MYHYLSPVVQEKHVSCLCRVFGKDQIPIMFVLLPGCYCLIETEDNLGRYLAMSGQVRRRCAVEQRMRQDPRVLWHF